MKIEYTTDGMEFHYVTLTSVRKKINKHFYANTKKEVKKKLIDWVQENIPDVPLWKIKVEDHTIGWRQIETPCKGRPLLNTTLMRSETKGERKMINDKQRLETYRGALIEAIVTIDRKTYGKWNEDWARLRRIVDMVLNHDRPIERAIYVAEEEVKIQKSYYEKRREIK